MKALKRWPAFRVASQPIPLKSDAKPAAFAGME
jgi:hypothetical protein